MRQLKKGQLPNKKTVENELTKQVDHQFLGHMTNKRWELVNSRRKLPVWRRNLEEGLSLHLT